MGAANDPRYGRQRPDLLSFCDRLWRGADLCPPPARSNRYAAVWRVPLAGARRDPQHRLVRLCRHPAVDHTGGDLVAHSRARTPPNWLTCAQCCADRPAGAAAAAGLTLGQAIARSAARGRTAAVGGYADRGSRAAARRATTDEPPVPQRRLWLLSDLGRTRAAGLYRYADRALPISTMGRLY